MYQIKKTYIRQDTKMTDLILENPSLLIMLEHFNINKAFFDHTICKICNEYHINPDLFTSIANIYNGFPITPITTMTQHDISSLIKFLQNSHRFYLGEKLPAIKDCLHEISSYKETTTIKMVKKFFEEYSAEIHEHLAYEDCKVFPTFFNMINAEDSKKSLDKLSGQTYLKHHTDIETKVTDLKRLFVSYITLKDQQILKRKLLFNLIELETDLNIHTIIEELILVPAIQRFEKFTNE